ncbi:hypothetical protein PHLGIDRAFT_502651 [Phlebiopsis gigantea 11061_1 CR5-6]|uniref:Uncharacterized protein n=1 Tax=Phlebiopsis gigantea (strain 11061_1 CR5-6) TaxID=745531 RepID=A0A0C3NCI2_PHLG1|nr:hypothetical protein PHLGIDRAFT_502651 [Phlebiopsis gigantea 11061_1 CR5-6]
MGVQRQLSAFRNCFGKSRREKALLQEQIANLTGEREYLTRQNQALGHERDDLEQSSRSLAREKEELERKGRLLVRENEELEQRCHSMALEKDEMIRHLERWRIVYTELEEKHDIVLRENQNLARLHTESEEKSRQLDDKATSLRDEFREKEAKLQLQLAQAHAAGTYLSTADSVSHGELLEMVGKLNAHIFQLASLLEDVVDIREIDVVDADTVQRSLKSLERWLEPPMLDQLSRLQPDDKFWVGIGLQAVVTQFAAWRINSWDFDSTRDRGLRSTYEAVFKDEPQAISARWRAISRNYAAKLSNVEESIPQAADTLTRLLLQVLWVTRSSITDSSRDWKDTICTKARGIVEQCRSIQKVIAGDIVSCSFEVVGRTNGAAFSNECMEVDADDISSHAHTPHGAALLCMSQLGLKGRERVEGVRKTEFRCRTLLKAKVFLQDVHNDI